MTIVDPKNLRYSREQISIENKPENTCKNLVVYTPEKTRPPRRERCPNVSNLGAWMFKVHFQAYRAVCSVITDTVANTGLYVINKVTRQEKQFDNYSEVGTYLRKFAPIDYACVTSKRAVNKVCQVVSKSDVFEANELKTTNQRIKEREIREMKLELGEKSGYSKFCRDTAVLVDDLFPKLVCAQMIGLPSIAEQTIMYKLPLPVRYINYQLNRRTNYRQLAINSTAFQTFVRMYWCMTTNFTSQLLCKENVSPILNFEHVLLKICMKLKPKVQGGGKGTNLIDVIIRSAANSIERLQECDKYMEQQHFDSRREALIERLEWYRRNDCLPPGMPDPSKERLNVSNLEDELDKAMYAYLDQISTTILDELAPKKFKNQFVRFIYWLEGKNGLVKLLSYLIGELGVKQVSDPHLFAIAILTGLGEEVADYELDGFGRDKMETIFKVGEKMIKHVLEEGVPSSAAVQDFLNTDLRYNPQSVEGIKQKKEARKALEEIICKLLYDGIKPESYRYQGGLKEVRKFMQKIPVLGLATVFMNVMYSTLYLPVTYRFRGKDQYQDSLPVFMLKSMWGKDYTETLTKKTMELIYHPGWRFVALQLIHDFTNHIFNKGEEVHQLEKKASTNDNIRTIASFVINHYMAEFTVSIEPIVSFLVSDGMIESVKEMLHSPGKPFLETAMESILPTINEITLYIRVGESFRKDNVQFEGDSKFWELFVREYLNRFVEIKIQERFSSYDKPSLEDINCIRDELVQDMLNTDVIELRKRFVSLPKKVDRTPTTCIKIGQELGDGLLIWDYDNSEQPSNTKLLIEDDEPSFVNDTALNAQCKDRSETKNKSDDSLNEDDFIFLSDSDEDPFND